MRAVAGVDGCKGGWVAVTACPEERPVAEFHVSFAALLDALPGDAVVAVDMPIGLPELTGAGGRGPEQLVRRFLGARQSSVFSIPSRAAVYAEPGPFPDWEAMRAARRRADIVARATSEPAKGLSFQAFALFDRIREIDTLLRSDPTLVGRVFESHPEAVFAALNGMEPMELPKKVRNRLHPAGMAERRAFLVGCGFAPDFLVETPPGAGEDDFLDACAVMLAARRIAQGVAVPHPDPPGRDNHGLPVAIWT